VTEEWKNAMQAWLNAESQFRLRFLFFESPNTVVPLFVSFYFASPNSIFSFPLGGTDEKDRQIAGPLLQMNPSFVGLFCKRGLVM